MFMECRRLAGALGAEVIGPANEVISKLGWTGALLEHHVLVLHGWSLTPGALVEFGELWGAVQDVLPPLYPARVHTARSGPTQPSIPAWTT